MVLAFLSVFKFLSNRQACDSHSYPHLPHEADFYSEDRLYVFEEFGINSKQWLDASAFDEQLFYLTYEHLHTVSGCELYRSSESAEGQGIVGMSRNLPFR